MPAANYSIEGPAATVRSGIEKAAPGQLFSLWWLTDEKVPPAEVANWPSPSAAVVRGTTLGALDYTAFQDSPPARATIINGDIVPLPRSEWRNLRMEDQFDAVLKIDTLTATPPIPAVAAFDVCSDRDWLTEGIRRLTLPSGAPGGPVSPTVQRLRKSVRIVSQRSRTQSYRRGCMLELAERDRRWAETGARSRPAR